MLGLTFAAASTDAITYLGLGHVFPANMTGNTVLLGIAVATGDAAAALRSLAALGGFIVGAAVAGTAPPVHGWTRVVTKALATELALLAAWCAWWVAAGTTPVGLTRYGLIALAVAAMGLQSGTVSRLDVSSVSTTYITGTWTALSSGIGGWLYGGAAHRPTAGDRAGRLRAVILACYLGGALAGAFARTGWDGAATAIPLAVLALVTAATAAGARPGR